MENNFDDSQYAGVDRRLGAFFIDIVLLYVILAGLQFLLFWLTGGFPFNLLTTGLQIEIWVLVTFSLPVWLYFTLNEASSRQASPGKRILKLEVTSLKRARIGYVRALFRTLIKLLPWELTHWAILVPTPMFTDPQAGLRPGLTLVYLLLGIYMLLMIFTPRKRSLHDLIVGTLVLDQRIQKT